ncbi:MAG: ribose ABC transporter permease [Vallitalea sp.]|jgi:ribose transport system permease protein|nr:ribose ABC transporter permease [Vallitalea sp.]
MKNTKKLKTNYISKLWRENSSIFALIVLVIFASIASDKFFQVSNIMNVLRQTSIVGLIAIGMTFVIIGGGIDLSAGSVLALSGGVIILLQSRGLPIILCIVAGCLTGIAVGIINGLFISKAKLAPFIVTLAISTIARSLLIHFANGATLIGKNDPAFTKIGNGKLGVVPIPVIIFIVIAIIAHFLLNNTKFGTYIYAIGGNEKTAVYSGIRVDRIKIATYMVIGLCIGLAAMIESARLASVSSSSSGMLYELDAITAVIIGGTSLNGGKGKISGAIIGILILGIISNIMNLLGISPYLNGAVKGLIILTAVLMQRKDR